MRNCSDRSLFFQSRGWIGAASSSDVVGIVTASMPYDATAYGTILFKSKAKVHSLLGINEHFQQQ
jgi:hypothetical protein